MNIKTILTSKPVIITVKTILAGAVVTAVGIGVKVLTKKKTGLPEGYEGDMETIDNASMNPEA